MMTSALLLLGILSAPVQANVHVVEEAVPTGELVDALQTRGVEVVHDEPDAWDVTVSRLALADGTVAYYVDLRNRAGLRAGNRTIVVDPSLNATRTVALLVVETLRRAPPPPPPAVVPQTQRSLHARLDVEGVAADLSNMRIGLGIFGVKSMRSIEAEAGLGLRYYPGGDSSDVQGATSVFQYAVPGNAFYARGGLLYSRAVSTDWRFGVGAVTEVSFGEPVVVFDNMTTRGFESVGMSTGPVVSMRSQAFEFRLSLHVPVLRARRGGAHYRIRPAGVGSIGVRF